MLFFCCGASADMRFHDDKDAAGESNQLPKLLDPSDARSKEEPEPVVWLDVGEDCPTATAGDTLTLLVKKRSGVEQSLKFHTKPLQMDYELTSPLVVRTVGKGGASMAAGIEVGDELMACNGHSFAGKDGAACHELLTEAVRK